MAGTAKRKNRKGNAAPRAPLAAKVLDGLRALDTPTVCNALEIVAPERRGWGYTTSPLVCPRPELDPIVGYARTATIRAVQPSNRSPEADAETRVAYYTHMAEGPGPTVTVIEDLDPSPGYGAHWGEVNTNLHKGLGSLGVVTNGSVRDIPDCAPGFQMIAGCVGPSHAFVHVVDVAIPVEIHGMKVMPGDLIHADQHGAVVVPLTSARLVTGAAAKIAAAEKVLIDASQQPDFSIEVLTELLTGRRDHH